MLAITPHAPSLAACSSGDHLQVLQAVTASGNRGHAEVVDHLLQGGNHAGDRGVADDVESGRHTGFGARPQMCRDGLRVQVAGPTVVGVAVRIVQPSGTRPQRAVDEQVAGQPGRAGVVEQRAGLRRGAHRLAPVADHLDTVGAGAQGAQLTPVVQAADLRAGAFVHRDNPIRGRGVQRSQPGFDALALGQQVTCGGADPVVGVGDQRALLVESGRRRQSVDTLPQTGGCQRRVHIDPGQVGGPIAEHGVEVRGGRRGVLRPRRLIPPVAPDRLDPGWPPQSRRPAAGSAAATSRRAGRDR